METFRLPSGFRVATVPDQIELTTPWMDYSARVTEDGDSLKISRELVIKAVKVPRDRYDEFRRFCINVDEYEEQSLILRRE